ncbi:MAG: hypothetical protein AB7O49_08520 [Sphingomonadales bacterium]
MPNDDFSRIGPYFDDLSPRFQRISEDAVRQTAVLSWPERLFFLAAAGDKHESWRNAYDARYVGEPVPKWERIVSAVIALWGAQAITCFEMAAIYTSSDNQTWRMAGEVWCVSHGETERLAAFWADPAGYSGRLVGEALDRLDRLAS